MTAEQLRRSTDRKLTHDLDQQHTVASRVFAVLLGVQFVVGIAIALVISPDTWKGSESAINPHVWQAAVFGALATVPPVILALRFPALFATRVAIAVGQMVIGALWIHLAGGRLEMHFHVFVSLALLAMFKDWRVLVVAAGVAAVDHVLRGLLLPMSIYGVPYAPWRSVEHAAWVVVETGYLVYFCLRALRDERLRCEASDRLNKTTDGLRKDVETMVAQLRGIRDSGELARRLEPPADASMRPLADGINEFIGQLEQIIARAKRTALAVAESSGHIASAAEQTSASLTQIAGDGETARQTAEKAREDANRGGEVIRQTITRIKELGGAIGQTSESVERLGGRGDAINKVISEIASIADRTNLLALNAAIEAARAGDHGRGFAVVADEVRKLAESAAQSTQSVSGAVREMMQDMSQTLAAMRHSRAQAEQSVRDADQVAEQIGAIVQDAGDVTERVRQIALATTESSAGSKLSADHCVRLATDAQALREIVERFKVRAA